MHEQKRILVAGIGNIFMGDDAFGVEVAQQLLKQKFPAGVRVVDFGIRGLDLAYALTDGYELVILIDAVPRGEAPGTLYVIEPDRPPQDGSVPAELFEGHSMDPAKVLRLAGSLGSAVARVLLVGCEPTPIDSDIDMPLELSPAVRAAIIPAVRKVEALIADHLKQPVTTEVQHASQPISLPA